MILACKRVHHLRWSGAKAPVLDPRVYVAKILRRQTIVFAVNWSHASANFKSIVGMWDFNAVDVAIETILACSTNLNGCLTTVQIKKAYLGFKPHSSDRITTNEVLYEFLVTFIALLKSAATSLIPRTSSKLHVCIDKILCVDEIGKEVRQRSLYLIEVIICACKNEHICKNFMKLHFCCFLCKSDCF